VKAPKLLECLDLVNLLAVKDQAVNKFSLGMKQRLGIAATFLNDPQLVILDEPTNGLDAQSVSAFNNLVRAKNQNGVTFLISSHLLSDLEPLSDRILMMSEGKVEYSGSTKELLKSQKETIVIKPKYRADLSRLSIIFKEAGINYLLHENSL
jgi:ABC-type multidrug transport system ATPase subunit